MSSRPRQSAHPVRRASGRVRAAAAPIAVAGVVALTATGFGSGAAPAAAADRVQHRLVADGYLDRAHASGRYDARTGAAIARWQADRGLRADGLVDAVTADELLGTGSAPPHRRIPA